MAGAAGAYFGQKQMGSGAAIPVNPQTGQLDINALINQMVDRRKTYVYDTLKLAPGVTVASTPYQFFKNPVGTADPYNGNLTKTEVETNMQDTGKFNPPYDMILNNLGFKFNEDVMIYDYLQIVKLGWFEFKILEKRMWSGHLWRHPPGAGVTGLSQIAGDSVYNNGTPEPGAIWRFGDFMKYIPPMVNFSLTLNYPETLNNYYNSLLPANVVAVGTTGTSLPTLKSAAQGGNGVQLIAFMNGLSDGPVQ